MRRYRYIGPVSRVPARGGAGVKLSPGELELEPSPWVRKLERRGLLVPLDDAPRRARKRRATVRPPAPDPVIMPAPEAPTTNENQPPNED